MKPASTNVPTTSPTVFQNPATGLPRRIESTLERGSPVRQESQLTGRRNGTPLTESALMRTACHRSALPPCHTCTCCRDDSAPDGAGTF